MTGDVVIAGNNLAALVAAQSIAAAGRGVVLINPAPSWGGHFAGVELASRRFDPGMILYEFDAANRETRPDLRSYDPARRNDCGRFTDMVRNYVEERVSTVSAPDPSVLIDGRAMPDIIIANHAESVTAFDTTTRECIRRELEAICAAGTHPLHASRKSIDPAFASADFASVSLANHGRTLHEALFEPLCRKILGVQCGDILATYHRAGWLPLYYPETLLSQFGTTPQHLPETIFHYPAEGSAGALVRALTHEIEAHPNIRTVRTAIRSITPTRPTTLSLVDGNTIVADEFIWALDPGALLAVAEPAQPVATFERASIGLCFVAIGQDHIRTGLGTLFVPDPKRAIYRVTDQDGCARLHSDEHRLVAEFSPAVLTGRGIASPQEQEQALLHELADLGLIDAPRSVAYCAVKILNNALMIPNSVNRTAFLQQQDRLLRHWPAIRLAGPSAGFHAGAMNDQIVQGLKLAAELGAAA
jgi:hypothetical protein